MLLLRVTMLYLKKKVNNGKKFRVRYFGNRERNLTRTAQEITREGNYYGKASHKKTKC